MQDVCLHQMGLAVLSCCLTIVLRDGEIGCVIMQQQELNINLSSSESLHPGGFHLVRLERVHNDDASIAARRQQLLRPGHARLQQQKCMD